MWPLTVHMWIFTSVLWALTGEITVHASVNFRELETSIINVEEGFPHELHVSVYMKDQPVQLRLTRRTRVEPEVPLFVICNGTMFEKNSTGDMVVGYYQDIDSGAALEVSCGNRTADCVPSLRGSFYLDRLLFELSAGDNDTLPVGGSRRRLLLGRRKRSLAYHRVSQRTDVHGNEISSDPESVAVSVSAVDDAVRAKRSYKTPRCVELVVVISYDLFDRWFKRSRRYSRWAKEEDALFNIRRYFAMVVHGVDLRYSSIMSVDFSLCVRLSAVVIATTKRDSPWTEEKVFKRAVDGAAVLPLFRDWTTYNGGKIGKYDHIQLFTGYDVTTTVDKKAVGLSYMASICLRSWAVSIVEDTQDFMSATTAATHELGHSLGAYHDGHSNVCPSASKYIMAPQIGRPAAANELNPWKFSQCSISYFARTIRLLKRYKMDCLSDKPRLLEPGQWERYTQRLPGQIYSPDDQCRLMHGQASFMSRKLLQEREVSNLCTGMWCHTRGSHFTFHLPARGTSCGNKQWCIDGKCVYDSKAPKLNDACPYGDYRKVLYVPNWTCERLVRDLSYLCHMDFMDMQTKCCASCAPVLAKSRGKRSFLGAPPSVEDIQRELARRTFRNILAVYTAQGNLKADSIENIFKRQDRRVSGGVGVSTALHTGYSGYFLARATSTRRRDVAIGDLPTAA